MALGLGGTAVTPEQEPEQHDEEPAGGAAA